MARAPRAACRARRRSARPTGARRARPVPGSPASVAGSTPNSRVAASRTARIIRSASSSNLRPRVPDGTQDPGADVEDAAVRIDERRGVARAGAPGHRVDGEVAAGQVDLDGVAELDPVRPAEVGVVVVGPEGRDLEGLAVAPDGDGPEPVLVDGARERARRAARGGRRWRGPSRPGAGRGSGRAATRRPRRPRDRPPGATRAGQRRRPGSRPRWRPAAPSVATQEEVRAPRLVVGVGEVRREQRVDVAARLERRPEQVAAGPRRASCRPSGGCTACTPRPGSPRCGRRHDGAARCGRASGRATGGRSTGRCAGRARRPRDATA